jgi:hypothetical protein
LLNFQQTLNVSAAKEITIKDILDSLKNTKALPRNLP